MTNEEKLYQIALTTVPKIGDITAVKLLKYFKTAKNVFTASKLDLQQFSYINTSQIEALRNFKAFDIAEKELENCIKYNIQVLCYNSEEYPKRLKEINDAPLVLYYKGKANLNALKVVSIVGTRKCTNYGREVTEELVKGMKKHNPVIISGLAFGIDICAHQASINNHLATVGVMATGLDNIYPKSHRHYASKMLDIGGVISENRMKTQIETFAFPARNRIIAGLSDAVIVIETARREGAIITADIANSYSREVFAVPKGVYDKYSQGCNWLIKKHKAAMLTQVEDIEQALNWDIEQRTNSLFDEQSVVSKKAYVKEETDLTGEERKILEIILKRDNQIVIDDLLFYSQMSQGILAQNLLQLELKGIVLSLPGKIYKIQERFIPIME